MTQSPSPFRLGLILILALLVAWLGPIFSQRSANASAPTQYATEVIDQGEGKTEAAADVAIRRRAQDGWEVVSVTVFFHVISSDYENAGPRYFIVFRK
jgi:hypothetical protein